jgi:hypothetical protein
MPTVTGDNALEWKMREMARRAGKKYDAEPVNPFSGLDKTQLKEQKAFIKQAAKELKIAKESAQ